MKVRRRWMQHYCIYPDPPPPSGAVFTLCGHIVRKPVRQRDLPPDEQVEPFAEVCLPCFLVNRHLPPEPRRQGRVVRVYEKWAGTE